VSGRQLLGTIRICSDLEIAGAADGDGELYLNDGSHSMQLSDCDRHPSSPVPSPLEKESPREETRQNDDSVECGNSSGSATRSTQPPGSQRYGEQQQRRKRQYQAPCDAPLELTFGGGVVARAVRSPAGAKLLEAAAIHCGTLAGPEAFPPLGCTPDGRLKRDLISVWMKHEHSAGENSVRLLCPTVSLDRPAMPPLLPFAPLLH